MHLFKGLMHGFWDGLHSRKQQLNFVLDLFLVDIFVRIDVCFFGQFMINRLINEFLVWFAYFVQLFKGLMH